MTKNLRFYSNKNQICVPSSQQTNNLEPLLLSGPFPARLRHGEGLLQVLRCGVCPQGVCEGVAQLLRAEQVEAQQSADQLGAGVADEGV